MRTRLTFQWPTCLAALSILAAVSAGCGGGSSKTTAKMTPGTGTTPAASASLVTPQNAAYASVVVSQGCNWKPSARTVIEAGCKAMRASLKIS